jgi:transposase
MPGTNLQNSIDFNGQKFYVGLDVHKKSWAVTVRSLEMQVAHFTQPPSALTLANTLKQKFPGGVFYSAYEAGFCGTGHHEQLCKLGIINMIVHPGDIPSTDKQKKNKTDLHDSRSIAEQLEKKNLHGIHILTREEQELRSLFRLRESKVQDVTRTNNRLKSFMIYYGIAVPESISKKEFISKKVLEWLDNLELASEAGTLTKEGLTEALKYQRQQECKLTKLLRKQIQQNHGEAYKHLLTMPGVGPVTSMGLLAEIGDFSRFDDPDDYIGYLGLTPWNDSSGDTIKTKGVQPRCNKHLRPLLIEAAWVAIRTTPQLFAYYSKHAAKNNKHAIIKVARRLALIARGVVLNKQDYQADYLQKKLNEKQQKRLKQTKKQAAKNEEVFVASAE